MVAALSPSTDWAVTESSDGLESAEECDWEPLLELLADATAEDCEAIAEEEDEEAAAAAADEEDGAEGADGVAETAGLGFAEGDAATGAVGPPPLETAASAAAWAAAILSWPTGPL